MLLILSVIALFVGPLLYQWLRRGGLIARAVEQGIVWFLVILVVFLLVPESYADLGYWALLIMAAGYLMPGLLELAIRRAAHAFHALSLVLALAGLLLHATLDGMGLATLEEPSTGSLGLAIVLHRFGVGLVLWFMVQPVWGRRAALSVLVLVAVATLVGFALSDRLLDIAKFDAVHSVQALLIGMIIHSLLHRGHVHGADSKPSTGEEPNRAPGPGGS